MTDRKAELEAVNALPVWKTKEKSLLAFQKKLTSLEFLEIKTPFLIQLATPLTKGVKGWLNYA